MSTFLTTWKNLCIEVHVPAHISGIKRTNIRENGGEFSMVISVARE